MKSGLSRGQLQIRDGQRKTRGSEVQIRPPWQLKSITYSFFHPDEKSNIDEFEAVKA